MNKLNDTFKKAYEWVDPYLGPFKNPWVIKTAPEELKNYFSDPLELPRKTDQIMKGVLLSGGFGLLVSYAVVGSLPFVATVLVGITSAVLVFYAVMKLSHRTALAFYETQKEFFSEVEAGDLAAVKKRLEADEDFDTSFPRKGGVTPLHVACERGHWELVSYLIEKGANLSAENKIPQKIPKEKLGEDEKPPGQMPLSLLFKERSPIKVQKQVQQIFAKKEVFEKLKESFESKKETFPKEAEEWRERNPEKLALFFATWMDDYDFKMRMYAGIHPILTKEVTELVKKAKGN